MMREILKYNFLFQSLFLAGLNANELRSDDLFSNVQKLQKEVFALQEQVNTENAELYEQIRDKILIHCMKTGASVPVKVSNSVPVGNIEKSLIECLDGKSPEELSAMQKKLNEVQAKLLVEQKEITRVKGTICLPPPAAKTEEGVNGKEDSDNSKNSSETPPARKTEEENNGCCVVQ